MIVIGHDAKRSIVVAQSVQALRPTWLGPQRSPVTCPTLTLSPCAVTAHCMRYKRMYAADYGSAGISKPNVQG